MPGMAQDGEGVAEGSMAITTEDDPSTIAGSDGGNPKRFGRPSADDPSHSAQNGGHVDHAMRDQRYRDRVFVRLIGVQESTQHGDVRSLPLGRDRRGRGDI